MSAEIFEIPEKNIAVSADIIRRSFKTVADEMGLTKENAPTNGAFLEDIKPLEDWKRGVKMFGLLDVESGVQVGFMAIEEKGGVFYLEKLSVLPEFRHRGYGEALVKYAAEHFGTRGVISIGIIYENKRLLKWYKKLGFEETGIKIFPHLPFTVCFMELDERNSNAE